MKVIICDTRYLRYADAKIRTKIYKLLATTNCDVAKLCRLVGIDRSTYYKWYNNYEEFQNIIKSSRAEFRSIKRENVISSLYRRAMGYMVTEVRETIKENAEGERIEKKIVYYKKYIPPSEKAIKYFLENFDEEGYEVSINYDVEEEDEEDYDDDNDDNENLENHRQEQVDSIQFQIEEEEIIEPETEVNIINSETQTVPVGEMQCIEVQAEIIVSPEVTKHAKLREAVSLVISESSPKVQKEVQEETYAMPTVRADFLVGLPCAYALHIASRIYEDKKIEYRKKHNIPFNDYKLKPYPVSFNSDEGERRMNESYRERMHDIPIIEEAKVLKKYIVAARMEAYYEDRLIMNKCYYGGILD